MSILSKFILFYWIYIFYKYYWLKTKTELKFFSECENYDKTKNCKLYHLNVLAFKMLAALRADPNM